LARRRLHDPAETLLAGLDTECGYFAEVLGQGEVHQVHLGGGSPTFLSPAQLEILWQSLRRHFAIVPSAELAIEIDPRTATREYLETLRGLGFNRVSLGIQDFDSQVQQAISRLQSFELVERVVSWCRSLGFRSINFDLIYGLPFQTPDRMVATLEQTIALAPDRIAFYRLAVIPEIFRWQNVFRPADLPTGEQSLELNLLAINYFQQAGYEFIGLDHFARSDEALALAARNGSLRRTFQGMTTGKDLDILGLGPSAISQLDGGYAQNRKTSTEWRDAVANDLATERGLHLDFDDRLRREVMQQLYGHGHIDRQVLEERFAVTFDDYFASELRQLERLVENGLVCPIQDTIRVTEPLGRLLVRVVAAVFDRYLPPEAFHEGLSPQLASRVG
jgi:oxygen-independent coproporphyrinogen-3 oxidase